MPERTIQTCNVNIIQMTGPYRFTYHNITWDPFHLTVGGQLGGNYYAFTGLGHFVFKTVTNAQPNKRDNKNKY